MTKTDTWTEEDTGRIVRGGNPHGYCIDPCHGVGVLHRHYIDVVMSGGVVAIRLWSADPNGPLGLHAYIIDQRCVRCRVQLIDDDRGGMYDAVTDDGEQHECLMCPGCDANKYEPCQCPDHTPEEPA